jgi:hypothetical protein
VYLLSGGDSIWAWVCAVAPPSQLPRFSFPEK